MVGAGLALFVAVALALPALVERAAARALERAGLGPARLDVRSVSAGGVEIADVVLAQGRIAIGHVSLRYGPRDLLAGGVRRAILRDLVLEARVRDGALDLGPLARLERGPGEPTPLPFDELALEGARLVVQAEGERREVALALRARVEGSLLALDARAEALGATLRAEGTWDTRDGRAELRVEGALPALQAWLDLGALAGFDVPGAVAGGARLEARVARGAGGALALAGSLTAEPLAWSGALLGTRVWADGVRLRLDVPAEGDEPVPLADASVRLALDAGALHADALPVALGGLALALDARATAAGTASVRASLARRAAPEERAALALEVAGLPARPTARGTLDLVLADGLAGALAPALASAGIALERPTLGVQAALEADAGEAPGGWSVALRGGRLAARAARAAAGGLEARDASLAAGFEAHAGPDEAALALRLDAPATLPAGALGAARVDELRLALERAGERGTLALDGRLALAPADGDAAGVRADALVLEARGSAPLGARWREEARLALRLASAAESEPRARWQGGEARLGALEARAEADLEGGAPRVRGALSVSGAEVSLPAARLVVADLGARVPFSLGAPLEEGGSFESAAVWLGDDLLPGIAGALAVDDGRALASARWSPLAGLDAALEAALDLRARAGEATLAVPRFALDPEAPLPLSGALAGLRLGGALALDARAALRGGRLASRATLTLAGASLASETWDASLAGIDAAIELDGLAPPHAPGGQRVTIARGRLGALELEEGELVLGLESARSLLVERASCGWAGGRVSLHATRIDPADPVLDTDVIVEDLDLGRVLEVFARGEVTGTGALYGHLPVRVDWPAVDYGDGFLYAAPGVGRLQILGADALLASLPEVGRRALRDLEYTVLRGELEARARGGAAHFRVRGRGKAPGAEQEVLLDANVHGFDVLLDGAIIAQRAKKGFQ